MANSNGRDGASSADVTIHLDALPPPFGAGVLPQRLQVEPDLRPKPELVEMFEQGLAKADAEETAITRAVLESLKAGDVPEDPELAAATVALLQDTYILVARNLRARGQLARGIRAVFEAADFEVVAEGKARRLVRGNSNGQTWRNALWWASLRDLAGAAGETATTELLPWARERRSQVGLIERCLIAFVLGDQPQLARQDAEEALTLETPPVAAATLLASLDDVELARALIERLGLGPFPLPCCRALLHTLGAPAVGLIANVRKVDASAIAAVTSVLSAVEGAPASTFFARMMEASAAPTWVKLDPFGETLEAATAHLRKYPARAVPILKHATSPRAKRLLRELVRLHPELAAAAGGDMEVIADAPQERWPACLVDPVWTRKRPPVPEVPQLEGLSAPAFEERIDWAAGEQERVRDHACQPYDAELADAKIRERVDAGNVEMWRLLDGSEAMLLEVLTQQPTRISRVRREYVESALAVTGLAGLDGILGLDVELHVVARPLVRVASPRLAQVMAQALASRGQRRPGTRWLSLHPEAAAIGLIPLAFGKRDTQEARDALLYLLRRGHAEVVADVAARYGEGVTEAIAALEETGEVQRLPKRPPKLPDFVSPYALPQVRLRGDDAGALPAEATEHLLQLLAFTPLDTPHPAVDDVREGCDPSSLADFAWELFELWLASEGEAKHDWAMRALGHFGGDAEVRKLAPRVRRWPSESLHKRAVRALDVLEAIGSDLALTVLSSIAQKVRQKGLRTAAAAKMELIAQMRDLSAEELADRIAPDLGLDAAGSLELSYGDRSFRVGFDAHLVPSVVDAKGKRRKSLPKPGKDDDAELAKAAKDRWKALKKDAKAVAAVQLYRLEHAMIAGRRWSPEVFERCFARHPLMQLPSRRLVWASHGDGTRELFRIDADGNCLRADGEPLELADGITLGVPHVMTLDASEIEQWSKLLRELAIEQPFPQIERPAYPPSESEKATRSSERFAEPLAAKELKGLLSRGWDKGAPEEAGVYYEFTKWGPHGERFGLRLDPGMPSSGPFEDEFEYQQVTLSVQGASSFADVDPIAMSEVFYDITMVSAVENPN